MEHDIILKLNNIQKSLKKPLYIVGGFVRDYVLDGSFGEDVDLSSPVDYETFYSCLKENGIVSTALYRRTKTVQFVLDGKKCEFTSFRKEIYTDGGGHTPEFTESTDDIVEDALRRDFKCNAIYYDIANGKFVDPLGGIADVKNKVINTVKNPDDVFKSDGLRLMRLARFVAELGFTPTKEVIASAKRYSNNILDISKERIYAELTMINGADSKHTFSPKYAHYYGIKMLKEIGVLEKLVPNTDENILNLYKNADFEVRLTSLFAFADPNSVEKALLDLKAPKKVAFQAYCIVKTLPFLLNKPFEDANGSQDYAMKKFLAENHGNTDEIFAILRAYVRAFCQGDGLENGVKQTLDSLTKAYAEIKENNVPLTLSELKISGTDLVNLGLKGKEIGLKLQDLLDCVLSGEIQNDREELLLKVKNLCVNLT